MGGGFELGRLVVLGFVACLRVARLAGGACCLVLTAFDDLPDAVSQLGLDISFAPFFLC